jgi:hypothetical protein
LTVFKISNSQILTLSSFIQEVIFSISFKVISFCQFTLGLREVHHGSTSSADIAIAALNVHSFHKLININLKK